MIISETKDPLVRKIVDLEKMTCQKEQTYCPDR